MSWFFALVPKTRGFRDQEIQRYCKQAADTVKASGRLRITHPKILLLGGGLPETFEFKSSGHDGTPCGWLVCGTGLRNDGISFHTMQESDWDGLLGGEAPEEKVHQVDGHYAAVMWHGRDVEIFVDPLELRRAYVADAGDLYVATSRVDWIIPFLPDPQFSLGTIASGWNLMNSFSDDSFLVGGIRVGPSGHVRINDGTMRHSWHHWEPRPPAGAAVDSLLKEATLFPIQEGHKLTLGLSGGIDSRTILALLSGADRQRWQVHSLGNRDNPDIMVAQRIAEKIELPIQIRYYDLDKSDRIDSVVETLREYSLQTEMTDSPFSFPRLSIFSEMYRNGFWLTDGGYGELLRRSYGNRLLLSGRTAMRNNDPQTLMRFFVLRKSTIFQPDAAKMLELETERQFQDAFLSMPSSLLKSDIGNWIDIFHIRYRLKNFGGASQGLYDHFIPNYMPFALSVLISSYLGLSSRVRGNNSINRRIIHDGNRSLERLPLISYGTAVPYWTGRNIVFSRAAGKLRKHIRPAPGTPVESFRIKALKFIKDYVFDRFLSADVGTSSYYDMEYLRRHIESFFASPNEADARVVDNWLTFDFWRELFTK